MQNIFTHVKTITNVDAGSNFLIRCFSDINEDNTTFPEIFKSDVSDSVKTVDNVSVMEGELVLSRDVDSVPSELDKTSGELTIKTLNDDADRYSIGGEDNSYLIYER